MNIEASATSDAQTLERLLANRYSCRGFLAEPVANSVIQRILAMAQRSPSWCNAQPWQVIVTKGEATERFRAALHAYVTSAPAAPILLFRANTAAPISRAGAPAVSRSTTPSASSAATACLGGTDA